MLNNTHLKTHASRFHLSPGGKYTWGGVLDADDERALDPADPNYDSEKEGSPPTYSGALGEHINGYKEAVRESPVVGMLGAPS